MAKLYFRHGTMGSAKTLNLLAVAHNYRSQGKTVLIMKPESDSRWGRGRVISRAGISADADVLVGTDPSTWTVPASPGTSAILVDESQFLPRRFVDVLRTYSWEADVPVLCYGLRTDFRGRLFEGSARLFELADSIEEIKTTCQFCNRKAILNMRLLDGCPTSDGPQVQLGGNESYVPSCFGCYASRLGLPS